MTKNETQTPVTQKSRSQISVKTPSKDTQLLRGLDTSREAKEFKLLIAYDYPTSFYNHTICILR